MTTYELHDVTDRHWMPNPFAGIRQLAARIARHRRRYRTLQSLARLDAIQLADIGLDPEHVADAIAGDAEALWNSIPRLR